MSSFLVEASYPGFSVGAKEKKMGMRASPTTQLVFEDSPGTLYFTEATHVFPSSADSQDSIRSRFTPKSLFP